MLMGSILGWDPSSIQVSWKSVQSFLLTNQPTNYRPLTCNKTGVVPGSWHSRNVHRQRDVAEGFFPWCLVTCALTSSRKLQWQLTEMKCTDTANNVQTSLALNIVGNILDNVSAQLNRIYDKDVVDFCPIWCRNVLPIKSLNLNTKKQHALEISFVRSTQKSFLSKSKDTVLKITESESHTKKYPLRY